MADELSMKQKVEKLGLNVVEFEKHLWDIDNAITDKCMINLNFSRENLEKEVYPKLREFKGKFGVDIPLGFCGIDLARLDNKLNNMLWDKEHK